MEIDTMQKYLPLQIKLCFSWNNKCLHISPFEVSTEILAAGQRGQGPFCEDTNTDTGSFAGRIAQS